MRGDFTPQALFDGFGNPITAYLPSEISDMAAIIELQATKIEELEKEVEKLKKKAVKVAAKKVQPAQPDE